MYKHIYMVPESHSRKFGSSFKNTSRVLSVVCDSRHLNRIPPQLETILTKGTKSKIRQYW